MTAQSRAAPVNVGTFVLDPALAGVSTPPNLMTHVKVTDPWALGPLAPSAGYVEIERPVRSAWLITVFAIPAQQVFDNPAEASTTDPAQSVRVLPVLAEGSPAWTPRGQFTVTGISGDLVFSDSRVPEAVGAGSVVLVRTDAGSVLLDSGQQLTERSAAGPVGHEIARRMLARVPIGELGEAVLMPGAPSGHNLAMIAEHYAIAQVRATVDQFNDPGVQETVQAVRQAQATYRQWLERSVRADLEKGRTAVGGPAADRDQQRRGRAALEPAPRPCRRRGPGPGADHRAAVRRAGRRRRHPAATGRRAADQGGPGRAGGGHERHALAALGRRGDRGRRWRRPDRPQLPGPADAPRAARRSAAGPHHRHRHRAAGRRTHRAHPRERPPGHALGRRGGDREGRPGDGAHRQRARGADRRRRR